VYRVRREADVPQVVLATTRVAQDLGFSQTESRSLGTVVSELATNILKYADRGSVALEEVRTARARGLQVTAMDQGPGIEDVDQALSDHYSSGGTLGLGLPGVRRMVDEFEIDSTPGAGTRVVIRKWLASAKRPARRGFPLAEGTGSAGLAERWTLRGSRSFAGTGDHGGRLEVAHVVRPCRGQMVSGDDVLVTEAQGRVLIAVVDGLGHGQSAHQAARAATRFLRTGAASGPAEAMRQVHLHLRGTVGAAASLCRIDLATGALRYAAVGNTVFRMEGENPYRLAAMPGTVGGQMRPVRVESAQLGPKDVLIIHTDGISQREDFGEYRKLRYPDLEEVAAGIVSRFGKNHDDAGIVVARWVP
jgi:anti-sigma regulatory factor (Ser/Thr protein kinase)